MKCVTNTPPFVWLNRIGMLDLVFDVYDTVYTTPEVKKELGYFAVPSPLIDALVIPPEVGANPRRFNRLVRRWKRKLSLDDLADVEVFVSYRQFSDADEMLFANKEAEHKFSVAGGKVRDIANLFEPAEEKGLFTREDSLRYLNALLGADFRSPYVRELISRISV